MQIAADNAVFGQTGPKVGSFDAGYGSSQLARLVGMPCYTDSVITHTNGRGQQQKLWPKPQGHLCQLADRARPIEHTSMQGIAGSLQRVPESCLHRLSEERQPGAGQKKAREIWFLARFYSAEEAQAMGLVNIVVPLARLEQETLIWCDSYVI